MAKFDESEDRSALWYASFDGNIEADAARTRLKGPNGMDETVVAIEACYNAETDKTVVGYVLATTHDVDAQLERTPFVDIPAAFGGGRRASL